MAKKSEIKNTKKSEKNEVKIEDLQEQLRVLRFKVEGSKSKNVKEAQKIKKAIARLLTAKNQK